MCCARLTSWPRRESCGSTKAKVGRADQFLRLAECTSKSISSGRAKVAILTAEDMVKRITAEFAYVDERGASAFERTTPPAGAAHFAAHPLCADWETNGLIVVVTVVDHSDGHRGDWRCAACAALPGRPTRPRASCCWADPRAGECSGIERRSSLAGRDEPAGWLMSAQLDCRGINLDCRGH
jgi:hypothetical protein